MSSEKTSFVACHAQPSQLKDTYFIDLSASIGS